MSFNIVSEAYEDADLRKRIDASVNAEALNNAELHDTTFAVNVRNGVANMSATYWAVAQAVQAAYEAGVTSGRGSPGHDQDVVTDGAITSAVVANWPAEPPTVPFP